ncbi:helix-turn-helix transcriptional regulator [Chitinophaga pinensis]|uniref:HTH luxR-type domain-containing protein n=1 Tax=Chitinophaga pinensis (strain ATCC 43595 / DSM 2588 / LMG 13176 / NBRC 15968 / NCIMB 11800 / UQM 2034) TaxID=485918 RepID=A0A979GRU1_CHIPD|nr:hypothetical protein [Chitinophaga pinensis]ACU62587.1 hypothetical protein Cpin_5155 [Chitinophaga pinensis DSM 2588]
MKSLLWLFISLAWFSSFAQTGTTDSQQSIVDHASTDKHEKVVLLIRSAEFYRVNKDYTKAITSSRESIALAAGINNFTEAAQAYLVLLNSRISAQELGQIKQLSDTLLLTAKKAGTPLAMAYAYYGQALVFKTLDHPESVMEYCQMALTALGKNPAPYIAAKIYYQLYAIHSNWNNGDKAYYYAHLAMEYASNTNDYNLLSNCYNAMSTAHDYSYEMHHEQTALDSSLYYLNKSEQLYTRHPGQVSNYAYAISCINLASYYLRFGTPSGNKAQSQGIYYANRARTVLKDAPNSQEVIASSLGILSEYAKRDGKPADVEHYLLEAYQVMQTQQPPYYYTMINVTKGLANFYENQGNYQRAFQFQQLVNEYSSKSFDQQKALKSQQLEIEYQTEKANNEVRFLKEREKSQQQKNWLYICVTIVSFLFLLFLFRSYHFRLRYSIQRAKQLELEKLDAALQLKLEKEEQARLKAEQQLMELQQQQLKKEVMANVLQLEHKNQVLYNLKDKLIEGNEVNMQKVLKEELILDDDFELAKLQIQQVHADFFPQLNEKAQRKLTLLDLKLCTYLYLQMDTRQIAQLMHVEAKSVRMSRYRIKQKLGLEKDQDLHVFLQSLKENANGTRSAD